MRKEKVSPKVRKMAKTLATLYRDLLKGHMSVYIDPFSRGIPLDQQYVFKHFVETAKLVITEKADPRVYLQSQFEDMDWRKHRFPYPNQLYGFNARLRYMKHVEYKRRTDDTLVKEGDFLYTQDEMEELEYQRLVRAEGSEKKVLKEYKDNFSRGFWRRKKQKLAEAIQ